MRFVVKSRRERGNCLSVCLERTSKLRAALSVRSRSFPETRNNFELLQPKLKVLSLNNVYLSYYHLKLQFDSPLGPFSAAAQAVSSVSTARTVVAALEAALDSLAVH